MEYCKEQMSMPHDCKPKCERQCVGEFNENFKVYEVCCREVVKVCPMCSFEYEPHVHHMCPRCKHYGHMGYADTCAFGSSHGHTLYHHPNHPHGHHGHHMGYGYGGYGGGHGNFTHGSMRFNNKNEQSPAE